MLWIMADCVLLRCVDEFYWTMSMKWYFLHLLSGSSIFGQSTSHSLPLGVTFETYKGKHTKKPKNQKTYIPKNMAIILVISSITNVCISQLFFQSTFMSVFKKNGILSAYLIMKLQTFFVLFKSKWQWKQDTCNHCNIICYSVFTGTIKKLCMGPLKAPTLFLSSLIKLWVRMSAQLCKMLNQKEHLKGHVSC